MPRHAVRRRHAPSCLRLSHARRGRPVRVPRAYGTAAISMAARQQREEPALPVELRAVAEPPARSVVLHTWATRTHMNMRALLTRSEQL